MLVFVTGASGYIGHAVVQDLLSNGHKVLGLARTDDSASILTAAGAIPHRGHLEDIESLKSGAKTSDGVIHLAFVHDFQYYVRCAAIDRAAISAMGEVMAGTGKPLVIASGTMMAPKGVLTTEDTDAERGTPFAVRAESADLVYALAREKGVRGSVVRLPPTVHGEGEKGMVPMLIASARNNGVVTIVGEGEARWPAVHRKDAAVLFRLALEKGEAGKTYNAVAEQGLPMKEIMGLIRESLKLPIEDKTLEAAVTAVGFLAYVIGADNPTSSEKTKKELGWHCTQPKLLEDMEASYFT